MPLLGSITKLQQLGRQFYADLADVFAPNALIRETWTAMSQDMEGQVASLQALPHSFWNRIKGEEAKLRESVQACWQ